MKNFGRFNHKARWFARSVLASVLIMSTVAPAQASEILAYWSQIMGQMPVGNAPGSVSGQLPPSSTLAPLNVHMRFVINTKAGSKCGDFDVWGNGQKQPASNWSVRKSDYPTFADLAVCDMPMNEGWKTAKILKVATGEVADFPAPWWIGRRQQSQSGSDALKITVFGDSGCRSSNQTCTSEQSWPFGEIVGDSINNANHNPLPDFVLHVGDYRYNETYSRTWDHWKNDFFDAAEPSLQKVPWAFSRGNHESCDGQYAGPGWFLFFGPNLIAGTPDEGKDDCKLDTNQQPQTTHVDPWYFDIAVRSTSIPSLPHRIIMLDSGPSAGWHTKEALKTSIGWANTGWANDVPSAWIATHRPIWGLDTYSANPHHHGSKQSQDDKRLEHALRDAVKDLTANGPNPCFPYDSSRCGLKAIVAGHQHVLENITFAPDQSKPASWALPQQVVVGNSGVGIRLSDYYKVFSFADGGMSDNSFGSAPTGKSCGTVMNWVGKHGYVNFHRSVSQGLDQQSGFAGIAHFVNETNTTEINASLTTAGTQSSCISQIGTWCYAHSDPPDCQQ